MGELGHVQNRRCILSISGLFQQRKQSGWQRKCHCKNTLFYKQRFYRQRNWQKIKQTLSDTLRLNFCYMKIFHILHLRYHPKIVGHILKNTPKNKCFCIHGIIRLIIIKMQMKMKNISHRYDINRPRSRHGHKYNKYKNYLSIMMLYVIRNT